MEKGEELIKNDTFTECLVILPDKLEQIRNTNNGDEQTGSGREYEIENLGRDENDKVKDRIQMWIMAGGRAEVAAAFKKKRFLQKSLRDLFEKKILLPGGMSVHFINRELTKLNNTYSKEFKDLLGVNNTSDVLKQGLANNRNNAMILLGERPGQQQQQQPAEFLYADDDHPVDNSLLDNLFIENPYDSDYEDGEEAKIPHFMNTREYRQVVTPIRQRLRSQHGQEGKGRISKKKNLLPSFRSRCIWQAVL